jgi:hypothetical protein
MIIRSDRRSSILYLPAILCSLCLGGSPVRAGEDEDVLRAAGVATDGPGLLDFFRKHTLREVDRARVAALVRQLGDDAFAVREKASEELFAAGPAARGLLVEASRDPDPEVRWRAAQCLLQLDKVSGSGVLRAAARVLARRRPEGAATVLLEFAPCARNPDVAAEVVRALAVVGFREGEPDPVLKRALAGRDVARRAAAGEALCRGGGPGQHPAARRMLRDPAPAVREAVALALLEAHDREAVPVLIALLIELPREEAWRVEEALCQVAGDQAPDVAPADDDAATRRRSRRAWEAWWKEHGAGIDLARVEQLRRPLGYTLICQYGLRAGTGSVSELDAEGRVRWQISGLRQPFDAQVLGPDRVLVCEHVGRAVTERNLKGEVVWKKDVPGPVLAARRLPGGNTFIVTRNRLLEVDGDGKEVRSLERPNDVLAACRLRNGHVGLVTTAGRYVHLDPGGHEVRSFSLGGILYPMSNIEVLPRGRVLVPFYSQNRVVEFDADGRRVWEATVARPGSVMRLPNGHTLVTSRLSRNVVEIDRAGQVVWSHTTEGRPLRASRR